MTEYRINEYGYMNKKLCEIRHRIPYIGTIEDAYSNVYKRIRKLITGLFSDEVEHYITISGNTVTLRLGKVPNDDNEYEYTFEIIMINM